MDPITIGLTTVSAGFVLNRIIPEIYNQIKESLKDYYYKTVIVTVSQNKFMLINILKFLDQFKQYKLYKCIFIVIDKTRYEIPIRKIIVNVSGYEFVIKCNIDNFGNIVNIVLSTWKYNRFDIDFKRIEIFNNFLNMFPSYDLPVLTSKIEDDEYFEDLSFIYKNLKK